MGKEGNVILEVKNLKKHFKVGGGATLKAVDDVSFFVREGETLGLVGESGCGKTTCGRTVIGMYDKTDGEVFYKGKSVHGLKGKDRKDFTKEVQIELGLTYLFIAHDLAMVKHISDRVAVMYLGSMVELAESEALYSNPKHPYTEALMSAIPIADPDVEEIRQRIMLEGDVPSPINTPPGCKFQGRCSKCMDICKKESPLFKEVEKDHYVACHLYD